ncbi:MAG: IS1595 family transposase [Candidatus Thiodiazotropha sp. (ex Lucinoma borealis)]|nr:IS1595 family transposase [Candidatus Thiodiazotropha sp. (ex Lucinoma borealis)]MCU7870238.1 IS1595 family transposase [Candidatus Thiodiazotropha sp. (ex Lucinoma borealis)]
MISKNRYYKRSRIAEKKFRQIIRYFSLDFSASDTARLIGISVRSINNIFIKLRIHLAEECEKQAQLVGQIEVDESYFGPKRIRGKRGRGAGSKTIVFGLFKRNGWVYTEIVPDARKRTLQRVIRGKVSLDSVIHSDGWRGYHGLVDMGYAKHYRVEHGSNEFANDKSHINGIESFWAYAKLRLSKMKGIRKEMFYLHLKETEFRFNHRRDNVYELVLKLLREKPI